jgi:acetyl esterase
MQLDPQARAVLERIARANLPDYSQLSVAAARTLYRETRGNLSPAPSDVARVENLRVPRGSGEILARLYRPIGSDEDDRLPALVYFHGGGWTIGDLDTHDVVCRELANLARCAVVSIDYRLAPEHKFPTAVEDAIAATQWVADRASQLGLDPDRIAIGGDSAGGNLAAVAALAARDAGGPQLAMQLLIYPATDLAATSASHHRYAEGYGLTRKAIEWFTANYLRSAADVDDWRASPLKASDLSRLPPTYIMTAGFDPLCDEGRAYSDRLHAVGVSVTYECFEGMIHGFITMGGAIAAAHHAMYRAAQGLRLAFASREPTTRA